MFLFAGSKETVSVFSWAEEVRGTPYICERPRFAKDEEVKRDALLTSANGRGLPKAEE
jgi:hypothetical protein